MENSCVLDNLNIIEQNLPVFFSLYAL